MCDAERQVTECPHSDRERHIFELTYLDKSQGKSCVGHEPRLHASGGAHELHLGSMFVSELAADREGWQDMTTCTASSNQNARRSLCHHVNR